MEATAESAGGRGFWSGKNVLVYAKISHILIVDHIENEKICIKIYQKMLPELFNTLHKFFQSTAAPVKKKKVTLEKQDYQDKPSIEPGVTVFLTSNRFDLYQDPNTISFCRQEAINFHSALHLAVLNLFPVAPVDLINIEMLAKYFIPLTLQTCENLIYNRNDRTDREMLLSFLAEKKQRHCYILIISYDDLFACLVYSEKINYLLGK